MALKFDGSSQYVKKDSDLGITNGAITLSAWIKCNAEISSGLWTISNKKSLANNIKYAIYYDYNAGTRRLRLDRTKLGVADQSAFYNVTLGTSDWHHIVETYDGTYIRGYLNGVLIAGPTAASGNGTVNGVNVWSVGAEVKPTSVVQYGNIVVADARVYNRALSANEIAEIYHRRGADRVWQGLVGWWRLDIPQCPPAMTANNAPSPVVISASHESTWGSGAPAYCGCYNCNYGTHYAYFSSYPYGPANEWWKIDLGSAKAFKSLTYNNHSDKGIKRGYVQASNNNSDWTTLYDGTGSDWPTGTITINFSSNETAYRYWRLYATAGYGSNSIQFSDFRFYPIEGICPDLSGNGNHGTPYYGPTYQDSPHRLRRGILVS